MFEALYLQKKFQQDLTYTADRSALNRNEKPFCFFFFCWFRRKKAFVKKVDYFHNLARYEKFFNIEPYVNQLRSEKPYNSSTTYKRLFSIP